MPTISESLSAAVQHHQAGNLKRAEKVYQQILRKDANHADALHLLGVLAHQMGKHELATKKIRHAIRSNPRVAAFHSNLGAAYHALGKLDEAMASYRQALQILPDYAEAHNNLGNTLQSLGTLDEAVVSFQRALQIRPDYAEAYNNLSGVYRRLGKLNEALACCQRAVQLTPHAAAAYNNLGNTLRDLDRYTEAEVAYTRALQIKTDYTDVYGNLASLYERQNRLEEAVAIATQGLQAAPHDGLINLAMAKCEDREGHHQEAIDRLKRVRPHVDPHSNVAKEIVFQLAQLYDRIEDSRQAFDYFTEANLLSSHLVPGSDNLKQQYCKILDSVARTFNESWIHSWSPTPPLNDETTPVFLVGFARSGTTLLNVILDRHPKIQALEEKPTLLEVVREIDTYPGDFAQAIPNLSPEQFHQLRRTYFQTVDQFIERRPGHVLIDKNPMNTADIGFILRLFPDAKFVVAVRHPYDVCLSCFMQDFQINAAMAGFFTLEDTSMIYTKVMSLWQQYLRVLPHSHQIVKYENVVNDFQGEIGRLLEFLNVEWDDSVLHKNPFSEDQGIINTPSYRQVTEPIYQRACYRWLRYAKHLAPILDPLNPYVEFFGYQDPVVAAELAQTCDAILPNRVSTERPISVE